MDVDDFDKLSIALVSDVDDFDELSIALVSDVDPVAANRPASLSRPPQQDRPAVKPQIPAPSGGDRHGSPP